MAGERTLPGLGLYGFWTLGSNGYKDQNDGNWLRVSALLQGRMISFVSSLPSSPADGDIYVLSATANINKVAIRDNGAWTLLTPNEGWTLWSVADSAHYVFDGSAWVLNDLSAKQDRSEKGVASGYASLNASGRVPSSQLPGGDDVAVYASLAAFPATGVIGTIYIALNTDISYVWDDESNAYVQQATAGVLPSNVGFKAPCRLVATSNIDIAVGGFPTIDGKVVGAGYRVLLTGQTAPEENGIYVASAGAWQRAADANSVYEIRGAVVTVWQGATYGSSVWFTTFKQGHTLGVSAMRWYQIAHGNNIVGMIDTILGSTAWRSGGGGGGEPYDVMVAASDEITALTTGTAKVTFRMPRAMTLTAVKASVVTAPTGSTLLTVDINKGGTSILSTKLTFDAGEKTTTTAATPAVISDANLAADAEITIDIDSVGSTIAGAGLKVTLIGVTA